MNIAVVIPTLNAAEELRQSLPLLTAELRPEQIFLIDSASNDDTLSVAHKFGVRVHSIQRKEFNHGGTRTAGPTACGC